MSSVLEEGWFENRGLEPSTDNLFFPTLVMIEDATTEISVLFDSSLKSWVLLLTVQPGHSFYSDLAGNEQLEFLLKISVITEENDKTLDKYKIFFKKSSESADSFKNEAELQQNINLDSVRYGSDQICPPVTSFAILDYNTLITSIPQATAGIDFLRILENKANAQTHFATSHEQIDKSEKLSIVLDYLRPLLKRQIISYGSNNSAIIYGLGVIVMPKIVGSFTMSDYIRSLNNRPIPDFILSELVASVLQLVIKHKVAIFDQHYNNELLDSTGKVIIIDFGRDVGLRPQDPGNEDFLTRQEKAEILSEITGFGGFESILNQHLTKLLKIKQQNPGNPDINKDYNPAIKEHRNICVTIENILNWIIKIELIGNSRRFPTINPSTRLKFVSIIEQMPQSKCSILYDAFKKINSSISVKNEGLTQQSIQDLISQGRIIGFVDVIPQAFSVTEIPNNIGGVNINTQPTSSDAADASNGSQMPSIADALGFWHEAVGSPKQNNPKQNSSNVSTVLYGYHLPDSGAAGNPKQNSSNVSTVLYSYHLPDSGAAGNKPQFGQQPVASTQVPDFNLFQSSNTGNTQFGQQQQQVASQNDLNPYLDALLSDNTTHDMDRGGAMVRNKKKILLKLHKNKTKRSTYKVKKQRKTRKPRKI